MKKNIAMRLASGIMLASLLSTCVISGTFAKYTTSDTATDSARVAKWGVTVDVAGEDAFAMTYDNTAPGTQVKSTVDVVAPGTNGTLATVDVTGTPEVAVKVTYEATLTLTGFTATADWDANTATAADQQTYCPIIITVDGTPFNFVEATTDAALTAKIAEVVAAINGTNNYDAGTDLDTVLGSLSITWKWAFETGADDVAKEANNKKDTVLGNLATAPEISFELEVTVEQVD